MLMNANINKWNGFFFYINIIYNIINIIYFILFILFYIKNFLFYSEFIMVS